MLILSPALSTKFPLGITRSSPLSTAHIRKSLLIILPISAKLLSAITELAGSSNSSISILPFENVSILIAEGNLSILAISVAAACSGFMIIASPSSSLIKAISS